MRMMKRNHGCEIPRILIFFDCETKIDKDASVNGIEVQKFDLCVATKHEYRNGKYKRISENVFESVLDFWSWFDKQLSKHRPTWAFAHNAYFDLTVLDFWGLIDQSIYKIGKVNPSESNGVLKGEKPWKGKMVLESRPFFLHAMGRNGIVKFTDTINYFPGSLAKLGESIGVPKGKFPGFNASRDELIAYCKNDVLIIEEAMTRLLTTWRNDNCGIWQPTAPMLALTSFRHLLPKSSNGRSERGVITDDRTEWNELERQSYYGGQVTCFYVGTAQTLFHHLDRWETGNRNINQGCKEGPFYLVDVRSLYPSVMRNYKYPFKRLYRRQKGTVDDIKKLTSCYGVIARVKIKDFENEYTVRTKRGQLQVKGIYTTVLAGPELERAIESNSIIEVGEYQVYCLDRLFADWVDYWRERREKAINSGDSFDDQYSKLILNSLSGKFGQVGQRWIERHDHPCRQQWGTWFEHDYDSGKTRIFRGVGGVAQEKVEEGEPWFSFPAISSFITAHGREFMRWVRMQLPSRSVLYQAVDSLLLTQEGYFALEKVPLDNESTFGSFQLKEVADSVEIVNCNHYRIGSKWVRSGSWGIAQRQDDGTYRYRSFSGIKSMLNHGPANWITIQEHELKSISTYEKGIVGPDGWTDFPTLPKWQEVFG